MVVKNLPVKGAPKSVKAGTKVRNIRLTDSYHNIDRKIDGFGSKPLKSEFLKKLNTMKKLQFDRNESTFANR